jgi:hypothetical protein
MKSEKGRRGEVERTSAPASGPVVSWRRVFLVGGASFTKYSFTALSDEIWPLRSGTSA